MGSRLEYMGFTTMENYTALRKYLWKGQSGSTDTSGIGVQSGSDHLQCITIWNGSITWTSNTTPRPSTQIPSNHSRTVLGPSFRSVCRETPPGMGTWSFLT